MESVARGSVRSFEATYTSVGTVDITIQGADAAKVANGIRKVGSEECRQSEPPETASPA